MDFNDLKTMFLISCIYKNLAFTTAEHRKKQTNVVYFATCIKSGINLHDILISYEKNSITYYFIKIYLCLIEQTAKEHKRLSIKM